ncbi:MAG: hypothetical protein WBY53_03865 [Acidobacteriaceae bacterium]
MSLTDLMDAPAYDPTRDNRRRNIIIGVIIGILLLGAFAFAGFVSGHGWAFSNLGYEHRVNNFFNDLQDKDYAKAYGVYYNDPDWQQHPDKYSSYPLARFTQDWTTDSPINGPITWHHVDKSVSAGSGTFGTGIIVAVRTNGDHKIFMYVNRADKTMTWPAPYEFKY